MDGNILNSGTKYMSGVCNVWSLMVLYITRIWYPPIRSWLVDILFFLYNLKYNIINQLQCVPRPLPWWHHASAATYRYVRLGSVLIFHWTPEERITSAACRTEVFYKTEAMVSPVFRFMSFVNGYDQTVKWLFPALVILTIYAKICIAG